MTDSMKLAAASALTTTNGPASGQLLKNRLHKKSHREKHMNTILHETCPQLVINHRTSQSMTKHGCMQTASASHAATHSSSRNSHQSTGSREAISKIPLIIILEPRHSNEHSLCIQQCQKAQARCYSAVHA